MPFVSDGHFMVHGARNADLGRIYGVGYETEADGSLQVKVHVCISN